MFRTRRTRYDPRVPELLSLPPRELTELVEGSGRARAVWRALVAGKDPFSGDTVSQPVRSKLLARTTPTPFDVERRDVSMCGTTKLRVAVGGERRIETVIIPKPTRSTVCVSTQAGCARGCVFCVTATMGLRGNLTAGEIVAQVVGASREAARVGLPPVRNVVYMGMGEPLDNYDAVARSIEVLCARDGFALAPAHVTLSTVGTSPEAIERTAELPVRLAWSLHAADDELRQRLVPTTRHTTLELRQAFERRFERTGGTLFVEVTLVDGVNDGVEHAEALATFLSPFPGVRVNLLPMNAGRDGLAASEPSRAVAYRQRVRERGIFCAIRRSRGSDRSAACGQLTV